jgi:hypothetical protein
MGKEKSEGDLGGGDGPTVGEKVASRETFRK